MSGGSVFGMTSDFNFEQSPYNEGALNSVENRQIANNPKSVEQVGKRQKMVDSGIKLALFAQN